MLRNHSLVGALVFLCTILSAGTPRRVDAGNLVPAPSVAAQQINSVPPQTAQITQTIDNSIRQQLVGNTDSALVSGIDLGAVANSLPLDHLWLQLRRSPESEQALEQRIDEMHDAKSPNFHQWLTAEQIGTWYGPAQQDINTVSAWLESQGFTVNGVFTSGMLIDFSGTAGNVQAAFGTQLHNYTVGGTTYLSNASDPSIPAALAPAVVGVVSLNDRFPHPLMHKRSESANDPGMAKLLPAVPNFDITISGTPYLAVAPGDFNTIYNVAPVWANGIRGAGQTIVVIEDTNIKNATDVTTFRTAFGLSTGFTGTFSQVHPTGTTTCSNPGVNGAEGEAALDAEWAGVAAPDAAIELASCKDTATVFGGLIASQNLINGASPPKIMSVSYGFCESQNGAAANQQYVTAWQQAAAEGITVFVSSGDEGAASCDANQTVATHGIAVSGFTSTPYNVSVGGTDFMDTYDSLTGGPPLSTYWAGSNSATFQSALSYIPEIPWNDSCASKLLYTLEGFAQASGATGFCNNAAGTNFRTTASGSGGPSNFSTKPSWQAGVVGIVADGKRDIPDVSLFSANGLWNHFLVYCLTDVAQGGVPCVYTNATDVGNLAAGGTSFAAPALAGIQALINQSSGQSWGNMNTQYYALAATEYGNSTTLSSCNSSNGNAVGSSCIFYDITQGDIDVNCTGPNCFGATGTTVQGILSTSTITAQPAYAATAGWDFATGLGSVNVANLVAALTPTFTVGGNISSLTGSVQLQLDGTSPTSTQTQTFSANGGFTFTTALNSGSNWTVSVAVQPTGQTCTVTNGTGTNLTANVTTVAVACTTNTFTIGGTIGGLVGSVGLKVDGTSPTSTQTQTFSANGGFTFTTPLNSGSNWTVSVATQPTGQTCVVTSGTGTNLLANVTTVAVACTTNTFTIGGTIGGLVGSVGLKVDGTSPTSTQTQTFSANGGFTFTTPLNSGSNWTVSVATQPTGQTCVVTSGTGTNLTANVTTVAVACTTGTFTIGGNISGLTGSVQLELDGTSPTSTQTQTFSANGGFTFTTPLNSGSNWTVSVATQPTGQTCVVTNGTGTNLTANVTTVAVACTTNTFTIGGTIGGLVGSVGLKVDGTSPTSTQSQTFSANGGFTFTTPLNSGSNWTVSVATQPTGQTCVVTNGTGTNLLANVTTVAVACTVNTFTLTYTADTNGTITGTTPQIVNFGANGSAVTAAPNTGYHFVQWSDTSTANPRTDNNVTANITVNASFAPNTLVFTTQPGDVARGQTLATVVVTEQDGSGNTVLDNTSSVDFTIAACGGAVDLGNVAMINGVATLTSSEPFYTPTSTPGLQISAATGVLTGSSQFFNVLPNSDLLFVDGFEACRL